MPYIITTAQRKEKLVSALLKQHGLSPVRTSFDGMLVCMEQVDPLIRNLPHVTSIIEVSDRTAERFLTQETLQNREDLVKAGIHVIVSRGDFEKCHGIVRSRKDNTVMVDINYLDRMLTVQLPLSDVELPAGHTFWED